MYLSLTNPAAKKTMLWEGTIFLPNENLILYDYFAQVKVLKE